MNNLKLLVIACSFVFLQAAVAAESKPETEARDGDIVFSGAEWASVSNNGKYIAVRKKKSVCVVDGDTGQILHEVEHRMGYLQVCVSDDGKLLGVIDRIPPPQPSDQLTAEENATALQEYFSRAFPKFKPRFFDLVEKKWIEKTTVRISLPHSFFFLPGRSDIAILADEDPSERDFDIWKTDISSGTSQRFGLDSIANGEPLLLAILDEDHLVATNVMTDNYFKVKLKEDGSIESIKLPGRSDSGSRRGWQSNNGMVMSVFLSETPEDPYCKWGRAVVLDLSTQEEIWRDKRICPNFGTKASVALARKSSRLAISMFAFDEGKAPPRNERRGELSLVDYVTNEVEILAQFPEGEVLTLSGTGHSLIFCGR